MRVAFFIAAIVSTSAFGETEFWLEQLSNSAAQYPAPAALQKSMASLTENDFTDCQSQLKLSAAASAQYFGAAPISLATKGPPTFIVFPSKYCYPFFGVHSIQFWVVAQKADKNYSLLLSARQDGVKVLNTATNGYSDLKVYYGSDETVYTFNGKRYSAKQTP